MWLGSSPLALTATSEGASDFMPYVDARLNPPTDALPADASPVGQPSERWVSPLTLGAMYVLELVLANAAGGISSMVSPVFMADWTPPTCKTPRLFAGEGEAMVQALVYPPGSSEWLGTRVHNYVPQGTGSIMVYVSEGTCMDDESGIAKVELWVSNTQSTDDDVAQVKEVTPGFDQPLVFPPGGLPTDFETEYIECDRCGRAVYVGVRCTNGAALETVCNNYGSVRIDGSKPICADGLVVLGSGRNPRFQSNANGFNLSKFDNNVRDRETGIAGMTYWLVNVARMYEAHPLAASIALTWADHPGIPLDQLTVYGDREEQDGGTGFELYHGHTYRVQYRPTNMIGMAGDVCNTSDLLIDETDPVGGPVAILQHDTDNDVPYPETSFYQYSQRVIRVAVRDFVDPESGIDGYGVLVCRTDGFVILPEVWVGTQDFVTINVYLEDKRSFYVNWTAYNGAELTTTVTSAAVTIDATKPIIDYMRDAFGPGYRTLGGSEVDVVNAVDLEVGCLFATHDDESGIREASWCLGPIPKTCDTVNMIPIHHEPRETLQSVRGLVDGATYYSTITVLNNAGGWETASTDGFTTDISPPDCGQVWDGPSFDRVFIGPTLAQSTTVVDDSNETLVNTGRMIVSWGGRFKVTPEPEP